MNTVVVQRPLITEKSLVQAAKGWYTFVVDPSTTKQEIAQAVHALYNVTVISVRTSMRHGKARRVGRKMATIRKPDWKKAMVMLAKGQKIDAFEVTPQEAVSKP